MNQLSTPLGIGGFKMFQPGDYVYLRSYLKEAKYGRVWFVNSMAFVRGKLCEIIDVDSEGDYLVKEGWVISDEMIDMQKTLPGNWKMEEHQFIFEASLY